MKELIAIQTELNVPKNQRNQFGGYNYRSLEDITEAVKPLLKKYGCVFLMEDKIEVRGQAFVCNDVVDMGYEDKDGNWHPDIRTVQQVKGLRYFTVATATLINSTGEKASTTAEAEHPESKKGMDPAQVSGATSSYARKYAACGLFAIDDNRDPDATNTHGKDNPEPRRHGRSANANQYGRDGQNGQDGQRGNQNGGARGQGAQNQPAKPAAPNPAPAPAPQTTAEKQLAFMARMKVGKADIEAALGKPFEQLDAKDNAFLRAVIQIMIAQKIGFEEAVEQQCKVEADQGAAQ